jgi:uncharacterized YkwD family protein
VKVTTKEREENTEKTITKSKKSAQAKSQGKQPAKIKSPKPTKQTDTKQSVSQKKPASSHVLAANDTTISSVEREVVRLVNIERSKQGLPSLTLDNKLSEVAEKKSWDMKAHNYFSHQSPTYGSPFDMLKQAGISYRTAGENIAAGYPTAKAVVDGWMNSEGHRENILNPAFTKIGVGYVTGGSQNGYWTQLFTG